MKKLIIISAVALFVFGCSDEQPLQDPPVYYSTVRVAGYFYNYDRPIMPHGQGSIFYRINPIYLNDFPPQNSTRVFVSVSEDGEHIFRNVRSGYYTLDVTFFAFAAPFRIIKQIRACSNDQNIRMVFRTSDAGRPIIIQ